MTEWGLDRLKEDDWRFIYSAVEAGWMTPRICDEMPDVPFVDVLNAVRLVRDEEREALKPCHLCRERLAKKGADPKSQPQG